MVKYNNHKGLNERMPGYQVKLGLGLHMGYAIEGAIGSYYKIDASYLSPHVNMSARLEGATKAFGVPMLVHESLHKHFTPKTKKNCRSVDSVVMAGNDTPFKLYTVDVDLEVLDLEDERPQLDPKQKKIKRVRDRIKRNNLRDAAFSGKIDVGSAFDNNPDLVAIRKPFTEEFVAVYEEGFKLYISGDWRAAKAKFEEALTHRATDPLSKNLLNIMGEHNFSAPADWKGSRFFEE